MEEDYNNLVHSIRTYVEALEKADEMYKLIKSRLNSLKFHANLHIEGCGSLVEFIIDSTGEYLRFNKDVEGDVYYPVLKLSDTMRCKFKYDDFNHYPFNGRIGHFDYDCDEPTTQGITYDKDKKLPYIIKNIDEFTIEHYFQYSTILDDQQLFLYVLSQCCTHLKTKLCLGLKTQYYELYHLGYAQHMLSTLNRGLENLYGRSA
jgi:hypothetical protein